MAKFLGVYKCSLCGNIVEVFHEAAGTLACCGQDMELQEEKTADSTTEKHVPVIEKTENGVKVTVGSTLHPMTDEHYIEWIELKQDDKIQVQYLKPGDEPVAYFVICPEYKGDISAREYCTVHGLWKN